VRARSADADALSRDECSIVQMPLGGDRVIHAPTGAILNQSAEAALHGRYVDAQAFEEPVSARR
jgi:hypothetical protein